MTSFVVVVLNPSAKQDPSLIQWKRILSLLVSEKFGLSHFRKITQQAETGCNSHLPLTVSFLPAVSCFSRCALFSCWSKQRSATASVQYYKWDQTIVENSECSHPVRKNISQFKNNRGESRVMEIPFLLAFHSLVSTGLYSLNNILWSHLVTCITI